MKILVDAFGGDNSPISVIKGCLYAKNEWPDLDICLCGNEEELLKIGMRQGFNLKKLEIFDAKDQITMDQSPAKIFNTKSESSMAVGLKMLKNNEVDAFISAGNTGALAVGVSLLVGKIDGIKRAALAPILPTTSGRCLLIDAGANLECKPQTLKQFAIMGSIYAKRVLVINSPQVGLLNVGVEKNKGTALQKETYDLLNCCDEINFIGNVEARTIMLGGSDVVVSDGLCGNIILKTIEGTAKFFTNEIKSLFNKNNLTKLAYMLLHKELKNFKKTMNYTNHGGAIFLGANKPIVKAHGSSNATAIKQAIKQAKLCVEQKIVEEISKKLGNEI